MWSADTGPKRRCLASLRPPPFRTLHFGNLLLREALAGVLALD